MGLLQTSSYGSWKSPITADLVAGGEIGLEQILFDGEDVYWIDRRAHEGGRKVIVRRSSDGTIADVTPVEFNARTRVHEYGGGDYFFFSSRRRHTRSLCDWSSDVCSSD